MGALVALLFSYSKQTAGWTRSTCACVEWQFAMHAMHVGTFQHNRVEAVTNGGPN